MNFQNFSEDLVAEAVGVYKRTAHTANGEKKQVTQSYACMHGDTRALSFHVAVYAHPLHFRDYIHGSKKKSNRVGENNAHGQS